MDSTKKHKVEILFSSISPEPLTHGIYVDEARPLLENLLDRKVDIDHSCGGFGTCGTCHYFIIEGRENLSPIGDVEQEMRNERGFADDERLACQSYVKGDIKIRLR